MKGAAPTPRLLAAVAVGGALGALLRWYAGVLVADGAGIPWTTLAINLSGSFLLALLPASSYIRDHPVLPVFLGTGVLGGYTTLSAYTEHSRRMLADGSTALAFAYLAGTLLSCVVAVRLAHLLSSAEAQHEFEDEEGNE
ncbi:fluoride efflux transporter FluC [Nocardioides speluncae]|uniref:fluoride efflux transporter FluC n=1 Tax=Nocardioides speluncae TaxID=2670337 RepID=UPI000D6918E4|nr:CrcB family protein [Nocardioides speluncae]